MPPACLAAIKVAYKALPSPQVEDMRKHLKQLIVYTHRRLVQVCAGDGRLLRIDSTTPRSSILPLFTPHPRQLARYCQERGFIVRPIVAPTVPKGSERVRICLHAANTESQVDALARAIAAWVQSEEVLRKPGQRMGRNARL